VPEGKEQWQGEPRLSRAPSVDVDGGDGIQRRGGRGGRALRDREGADALLDEARAHLHAHMVSIADLRDVDGREAVRRGARGNRSIVAAVVAHDDRAGADALDDRGLRCDVHIDRVGAATHGAGNGRHGVQRRGGCRRVARPAHGQRTDALEDQTVGVDRDIDVVVEGLRQVERDARNAVARGAGRNRVEVAAVGGRHRSGADTLDNRVGCGDVNVDVDTGGGEGRGGEHGEGDGEEMLAHGEFLLWIEKDQSSHGVKAFGR